MKKIYIFFLLYLDSFLIIGSDQTKEPLIARFSFSCNQKNNRTNKELKTDCSSARISFFKKIILAALQKNNRTIITVRSDNDPNLKLLRVQLTDLESETTFLIKYSAHFSNNNFSDNEKKSIWDFTNTEIHKVLETNPYTAAEVSEFCINNSAELENRIKNILLCRQTDRLDFYPQKLTALIKEEIFSDKSNLEKYEFLDPRVLDEIKRDNRFLK